MKSKASTPPTDEGAKSPLEQQSKEEGERGELSNKEKEFVQQYMADLNATRAAMRAGYTDNPASAAVLGSKTAAG
jgi:hypothetical protein